MEDSLIEKKRAERKALLRALYGLVDGREGFTITPMQYLALGSHISLEQDVTGHTVRFLVSEGMLEYKPASEAVSLTHKGVVEVERQSEGPSPDARKVREAKLKALPDRILNVLKEKPTKLQMEELKETLPEFGELPDSDWYAVINDLLSDGMIKAAVVRSGIYDAIGAAYNIEITSRGRALTPEQPIQTGPMPMKEGVPLKLVTRKGECFEMTSQRKEIAQSRDGVFYLFHLNDLSDRNRGERLVSVFRFGPEQFYAPDYDARVETVLLNTIRRAFDFGRLTFDGPYDPHTYTEILLQPEDFRPQRAASGDEIQELIKHEAYWLAFRHNPNPGYPMQFDSPTDLEYLGVNAADVQRYVWLLGQRGLLEKIREGFARPAHRLIDDYEARSKQPQASREGEKHDEWDVFISHSTEDKDAIARPLAQALKGKGLRVWYDEFSLAVGDSLRKSIDHGLAHSRYGVVILSPRFFAKHWPEQELNGLATQEVDGKKVILPVWHEVSFNDVRQYSPTLADRVAVNTNKGLSYVVDRLLEAVK